MVRGQLRDPADAQQGHGAEHVLFQDLDGPVHAGPSAGHQPVEVGAADQREVGAQGQGGDDVRAAHDAGVQDDRRVAVVRLERRRDVREQVERDRGAVQLAAAMVGQHDAVGAVVHHPAGVLDGLDALDHELALPRFAQPVEVIERQGGVEHRVDQVRDGAGVAGQRREGQRLVGEEVEPPRRPVGGVQHGLDRQRRRDGHAVADVAQPGPGDGGVHGDHQGVVAGLGGALDQLQRTVAVRPQVELEPVPAVRRGGGHVLDGGRAHGGERVRDAGGRGGLGPGVLALGLHHPGEAGRCDADREPRRLAEDLRAEVHVGDIAQDAGTELDVQEGLAGAAERDFGFGGAVGVVERGLRGAALGHVPEVPDGAGTPQSRRAAELGLLELHQRGQVRVLGDAALERGRNASRGGCGGVTARAGVFGLGGRLGVAGLDRLRHCCLRAGLVFLVSGPRDNQVSHRECGPTTV